MTKMHRRFSRLVAVAAVGAAVSLPSSHATAADSARACFAYRGYPVRDATTWLEYLDVNGYWQPQDVGGLGSTGPHGCVFYNLGSYSDRYVRIRAFGVNTAWNGFFNGVSAYYTQPDRGYAWLGVKWIPFIRAPAAAPPVSAYGSTQDLVNGYSGLVTTQAQLNAVNVLGQSLSLDAGHDNIIVRTCDTVRYNARGVLAYRPCS